MPPEIWSPRATIPREAALQHFRKQLKKHNKSLLITSPPYTGKTHFARQLQNEPGCVAAYFCEAADRKTKDPAVILKDIVQQLQSRLPGLIAPTLSHNSLYGKSELTMKLFLQIPLAALKDTEEISFMVIDDLPKEAHQMVMQIAEILPSWLRLVVLTRPGNSLYQLNNFEHVELFHSQVELVEFIKKNAPGHNSIEAVFQNCLGSWSYISILAASYDAGQHITDGYLPIGTEQLCHAIFEVLPPAAIDLFILLQTAVEPPTKRQLVDLALYNETNPNDINFLLFMCKSQNPNILTNVWADYPLNQKEIESGHDRWAAYYGSLGEFSNVAKLAYHLVHGSYERDCLEILRMNNVHDLVLHWSIYDMQTTCLLLDAGAKWCPWKFQDDFVLCCTEGDIHAVAAASHLANKKSLGEGLIAAASHGHFQVCKLILELEPTTAFYSSPRNSYDAIRAAALNNQCEVVRLLLNYVPVKDIGRNDRHPLKTAIWADNVEVMDILLQNHGDLEQVDYSKKTLLLIAACRNSCNVVEYLLKRGCNIRAKDQDGRTALHCCLYKDFRGQKHRAVVQLLIKYGIDLSVVSKDGLQAIHVAAYNNSPAFKELAAAVPDVNIRDLHGTTALIHAIQYSNNSIVDVLLDMGSDVNLPDANGKSPLMHAASKGNRKVVEKLLSFGAKLEQLDDSNSYAFHYAAGCLEPAVVEAVYIEEALEHENKEGEVPLYIAVNVGHTEIVNKLIQWGASVNYVNRAGKSLTLLALSEGKIDGCEYLLELGADPKAANLQGQTLAHLMVELRSLSGLQMLHHFAVPIDRADFEGNTPLHCAVWADQYGLAEYMLAEAGVNPDPADSKGATPLAVASYKGDENFVTLLLKHGANPRLRDHQGLSSLDAAQHAGHVALVPLLAPGTGSAFFPYPRMIPLFSHSHLGFGLPAIRLRANATQFRLRLLELERSAPSAGPSLQMEMYDRQQYPPRYPVQIYEPRPKVLPINQGRIKDSPHFVLAPTRLMIPQSPTSPSSSALKPMPGFAGVDEDNTPSEALSRLFDNYGDSRTLKGLRHFSNKVSEKVKQKVSTTYNEVADELVTEYFESLSETPDTQCQTYDMKNIRRRVYDALNVLMAVNIIVRQSKVIEIRWNGLPVSPGQEVKTMIAEKKKKEKLIRKKYLECHALMMQLVAYTNLGKKNEEGAAERAAKRAAIIAAEEAEDAAWEAEQLAAAAVRAAAYAAGEDVWAKADAEGIVINDPSNPDDPIPYRRIRRPLPEPDSLVPFLLLTIDEEDEVEIEFANDDSYCDMHFEHPYEMFDDIEVLKRMGLTAGLESKTTFSVETREAAKAVLPKKSHDFVTKLLDEVEQLRANEKMEKIREQNALHQQTYAYNRPSAISRVGGVSMQSGFKPRNNFLQQQHQNIPSTSYVPSANTYVRQETKVQYYIEAEGQAMGGMAEDVPFDQDYAQIVDDELLSQHNVALHDSRQYRVVYTNENNRDADYTSYFEGVEYLEDVGATEEIEYE
ncbi:unnamed protein product, partial [Mesorhabditis spiculigera]